MLEFRLLGPLEVREGGATIEVRRQKQRAVLAALLLHAGEAVGKDRLVEDVWGERAPPRARQALENYVSQLRKLLGRDVLVTRSPGYMLQVGADQVDVLRLERLLDQARSAEIGERAGLLREALSLFRGPPLADLVYEPFAEAEALRLQEVELAAREDLVDARLALGEHAEVVSELEALIAKHPFRERLRGQLMLALYRSGRQADALAAYQRSRAALVDELGIEPSEELQELERAILRQDDALRAPERTERVVAAPAVRAPRPRRKTVTILFAQLADSSALVERLDPELWQSVVDQLVSTARATVDRYEATVELTPADSIVAVFGVPAVHEDDPLRAARAATELRDRLSALDQDVLRAHGLQLSVRIGVSTGEAIVGGAPGERVATGATVALAEQLARSAGPGEIVLTEATNRLLAGQATVTESVPGAFVLDDVLSGGSRPLRLASPMVGRERQLTALTDAFESAAADRACHLFTVLGAPGVGKSRLLHELVDRLEPSAAVLQGRCLAYGGQGALWPLVEAVREAAHTVHDAEEPAHPGGAESLVLSEEPTLAIAAQVNELMRLVADDAPEAEAFAGARRLFESIARIRPLLVAFDDIQWADPVLLDLVEDVVERSRDAPILIVCGARPELLQARPSWGGGKPNAASLLLEPLSRQECERLMDNLLGESDLPAPLREHIAGAADGNPLFVEEFLASLVDQDVLRREDGRWTTTELPVLAVPPSILAVIAARIDRLPEDDRVVLELASVEGTRFHREGVAELAPPDLREGIDAGLDSLVARDLIRPRLGRQHSFAFRHQLVRDAAYESMPKQLRAELHERFAGWLERRAGGRITEVEEILGHHLEQASLYRAGLGEVDAARALAERADALRRG